MQITDIEMEGNEHGRLAKNTIYAKLRDDDGEIVISATLDYILIAIRDRKLLVPGVSISFREECGAMCSTVTLTKYDKR